MNIWKIQEANYLAWTVQDDSTHSPRGVTATVKSSMGALPGSSSVNTRNSCLDKSQKQHQRRNTNGSPNSHCFHLSLDYEEASRDGDLGQGEVWGEGGEWTAIYGGKKHALSKKRNQIIITFN